MKTKSGHKFGPLRKVYLFIILAAGILLFTGCKDNVSNPDPQGSDVVRVEILTGKTELWIEDTLQVRARLYTESGDSVTGRTIGWYTDKPEILEVTSQGILRALNSGEAKVTATYQNLSSSITIEVYRYDLLFESVSGESNQPSIYRLALNDESAVPVQLLGLEPFSYEPAMSSDGTRMVYSVFDSETYNVDLYLYNFQEETGTRLTFSPEIDDMASWSPDHTQLVFRRELSRGGDIMIYRFEDQSVTNLTDFPDVYIEDRQPAWSPDGSQIVYSSNESGRMNIYLIKPDGSDKRQLRFTEMYDTEAAWSPDGKIIIYRTNYAGGFDFTLYHTETEVFERLEIQGYEFMPVWSPDGRWIAFVWRAELQDRPEIYLMRPDGTEMRRITKEGWNGGQNPAFLRVK
ncbi:hypothetical protein G3570_01400 [Balneolaceae bacterium YR4-1]|uniref:BIG2 domain-containing protein n=1 Tax=Halalkalibaculum roseum TaxID=2709311 RepID=A0A6M1T4I6_9BACT|nr:PD40 domain-containing protein [Halalkalibaculum roseum]NGP75273.1 hypothetical protein [Halalkalibaculum roseum]